MNKRETVMLAKSYNPEKHNIENWLISEKLDGMRAIWDGGASRGKDLNDVPYANQNKVDRFVEKPKATGLWSRYWNPIQAPDEWLNQLPERILLDGELYMGRGMFQQTVSATKRMDMTGDWSKIKYKIFDLPPMNVLFYPLIMRLNGGQTMSMPSFDYNKYLQLVKCPNVATTFKERLKMLQNNVDENAICKCVEQVPNVGNSLDEMMDYVLENGGEGLILKNPNSYYLTKRSDKMLKIKPSYDDEATIVGYITGKETDKGSKLLGMLGALILDYKGKRLELSGFSDSERELCGRSQSNINGNSVDAEEWAATNPGQETPQWIQAVHFPIGTEITFKYRELSNDGIPKEARYFRKRNDY